MNPKNDISDRQGDRRDIQDDQPVRFWNLRSSVSIGLIILGLLQISTNGVYNFFSDVPGFQLYPFFIFLSAGIWYLAFHIALRLKNVPWIFMIASAVCCLFFVITTQQVDRKIAANNSAEGISIEPGALLDPANPFESSFTIQNTSKSSSIFHLYFADWWNDPDSPAKRVIIATSYTNEIAEIGPNQKADLKIMDVFPGYPWRLGDRTYFELDVWYIRDGRHYTNYFQFQIANHDGKFAWYRRGTGQGPENFTRSFIATRPTPKSLEETIPWLVTKIKFLGPADKTTNSYPTLSLVYSVTNSGGIPARDITYFWYWEDTNSRPVIGLPPMKIEYPPDGISALVPGAGGISRIDLRDDLRDSDSISQNLINGKMLTIGEVSFLDLDGTAYQVRFRVVHHSTNNSWEVQNLQLSDTLKARGFHDFYDGVNSN
jgi:hypothetical protein